MITFFTFLGIILFLALMRGSFSGFSSGSEDNFWHLKLTPSNGFIIVLLFLVLLALGERVLYDLARIFIGEETYNYLDNLATISLHALVILPLLIVSIAVNIYMGEKRQRYAVVLVPYFIAALVLSIQLAIQFGVYFYNHHTQIQFYIVMTLLTAICSVAIYLIQERFNKHLNSQA